MSSCWTNSCIVLCTAAPLGTTIVHSASYALPSCHNAEPFLLMGSTGGASENEPETLVLAGGLGGGALARPQQGRLMAGSLARSRSRPSLPEDIRVVRRAERVALCSLFIVLLWGACLIPLPAGMPCPPLLLLLSRRLPQPAVGPSHMDTLSARRNII